MPLQRHLKIVACNTENGFMDTALKVAFATTDMKTVNQHFGTAEEFAIYAVDIEQAHVLEIMQFDQWDQDGNEDKLVAKMNALDGCIAVYSQAVGASAIVQLKMRNIRAIRVTAGAAIADILKSLQDELYLGTNSWLTLAVEQHKAKDPDRFDAMETEGWEE